MYTFIQMFISIIFALSLSACANAINTQQEKKELVGPEWIVESFEDTPGRKTHPGTVTLRLRFLQPDSILDKPVKEFFGTFIGKADNQFSGPYHLQGKLLSLRMHRTTLVGRLPGSREQDFIDALNNATVHEIHENRLRIYYFEKTRAINLVANE